VWLPRGRGCASRANACTVTNMSSIAGVRESRALREAVDALVVVDHRSLGDGELADLVVAVDTELGRLTAVHARLAAAVDATKTWTADGSKSCAAWLGRACTRPRVAAGRAVRLGRALRSMPTTDTAWAAGKIGPEHAAELAACWRAAPDEFADYETTLIGHARTMSFEDFERVCTYWRHLNAPERADTDAAKNRQQRHLFLRTLNDGTLLFQGRLDPVDGAALTTAIQRLERQLFDTDWAQAKTERGDDVRVSDLARTGPQRHADALTELVHQACSTPPGARRPEPLVTVYVDYQTATGRLCELANGTPITPSQLLPLFTQADIERAVFGPRNRVIDLGERTRFFTGGLRRAIQLRDRHCQWPGCDTPAEHCHVDHIEPYTDGGPTTQDNGRLLCARHNLQRHQQPLPDDLNRQRCRQRLRDLIRERTASSAAAQRSVVP